MTANLYRRNGSSSRLVEEKDKNICETERLRLYLQLNGF